MFQYFPIEYFSWFYLQWWKKIVFQSWKIWFLLYIYTYISRTLYAFLSVSLALNRSGWFSIDIHNGPNMVMTYFLWVKHFLIIWKNDAHTPVTEFEMQVNIFLLGIFCSQTIFLRKKSRCTVVYFLIWPGENHWLES